MAYSAQVVSRARQRLEQSRAQKESQTRQHLQTVYREIPRVREIDMQLRKSMVIAAQALFSQENGAQQAMEAAKQANLSLQRERAELIEAAFGKDYLDESPVCTHCGGTGYIGSRMCTCLQEICRQEQRRELSLLACGESSFAEFRLEYYPDCPMGSSGISIRAVMKKTFTDCRSYAEHFGEHSENLLFSGDTGLGKTFLSACIARSVADQGFSVMYESAAHLFEKLEKAKFSGDGAAIAEAEKYTCCDLLIVDDLGTEMSSQFVTAALYTLINDRLLSGRATIISTNMTAEEMAKRYSPQILSRLRGSYRRVPFVGEDIRILKNRGTVL